MPNDLLPAPSLKTKYACMSIDQQILMCTNPAHADADEGSAAGGSSSSGGAGPSGSSPDAGGMRLYLSQIREWIVEFSCDMLFISMRTDVAWYRLAQ